MTAGQKRNLEKSLEQHFWPLDPVGVGPKRTKPSPGFFSSLGRGPNLHVSSGVRNLLRGGVLAVLALQDSTQ